MIQRHSSRCELKIKLDLPCNGTTMTFFPLFPQKTSKSIGITPGKLWNCSWSQCLNIDIMNIYSNWIIHSAIKWGTFWHERRPVSDGHLTTVILRLKRKKNIPFSNGANSFIRGNDASASTWHHDLTSCKLFGFKGAGPNTSLCAFQTNPWPKCWLHTNTAAGRTWGDQIEGKHRRNGASLYFKHCYLLKVQKSKRAQLCLFFFTTIKMMETFSNNTNFGWK